MASDGAKTGSTAREIRTVGPRQDPDALRAAYLGLLKLCLCDLAGVTTREVTSDRHKRLFSRALSGEDQLQSRAEGKDWPLDGLTMVGLRRLDDLQACVESVVADGVPGDLIEAGAWRGGASILIRATLDSLAADQRTLWVADSFQGFPAPDEQDRGADRELEFHMSKIEFPFSTVERVQGYFARFGCDRNVRFVPGYFEQTMSTLTGWPWSLIRLDADTYKATKLALEALYPTLATGGYVVVDDYFHPLLPEACRSAVDEFRQAHGISEPIEQIDWTGARWRKQAEAAKAVERPYGQTVERQIRPSETEPERPTSTVPASAGGDARPIPTDHEVQLADELGALRARLRELEAELARSRSA